VAESFDVIVVGARCAGSGLACHLARSGASVALVDAARLPSDQRASTHLVQPPGIAELDALGIGKAVRHAAPALHALRLSYDGEEARLPYGEGRTAHCVRREQLDGLLQDAAAKAGADLRDGTRVVDLIRDGEDRVRGVVTLQDGSHRERLEAGLVVGADGRGSTVAKLTGAAEYLGYEGARACYWAYWNRPSGWTSSEFHNIFQGRSGRVVFPTGDDQVLIGTTPAVDVAETWRHDHRASYLADVRGCNRIGPAIEGQPVGEVRAVLRPRYFFRVSAGPGWALIGDAGHHKEFVVGLGISEALRDARALAAAIGSQKQGAIEEWWRRRDVARIELFHWSRDLGRDQRVNPLQRLMAARMGRSARWETRFGDVIDGSRSPLDLVRPDEALAWVGGSLLRGETGTLVPFVQAVGLRLSAKRDLRHCRRRLRRAQRSAPAKA
jgi:flavin-dependent dehydrogenase